MTGLRTSLKKKHREIRREKIHITEVPGDRKKTKTKNKKKQKKYLKM